MHLLMIVFTIILAVVLRLIGKHLGSGRKRLDSTLILFIFPPVLILMTLIAVLFMGPGGMMLGHPASWFPYVLAATLIMIALGILSRLAYKGWQSVKKIKSYPQEIVQGNPVKIVEIDFPYSAQIGFWRSHLIVSRGLLKSLDADHLKAVLAHEQAHYDYHDTFWFFWLGWLKAITNWLPHSESLWQELLMLREIRADHEAKKNVDPLVLAESLLFIAQEIQSSPFKNNVCAAFSDAVACDRLEERINALFDDENVEEYKSWRWFNCLCLTMIPLGTIFFHS